MGRYCHGWWLSSQLDSQIWWAGIYYCGSTQSWLRRRHSFQLLWLIFNAEGGWCWPVIILCFLTLYEVLKLYLQPHQTHFSNVATETAEADRQVEAKPEFVFLPWLHSVQALLQWMGGRSGFGHRIWILYLQCSHTVPLCNRKPALTLDLNLPANQIFFATVLKYSFIWMCTVICLVLFLIWINIVQLIAIQKCGCFRHKPHFKSKIHNCIMSILEHNTFMIVV